MARNATYSDKKIRCKGTTACAFFFEKRVFLKKKIRKSNMVYFWKMFCRFRNMLPLRVDCYSLLINETMFDNDRKEALETIENANTFFECLRHQLYVTAHNAMIL